MTLQQYASYGFGTVESPLSDSGLFGAMGSIAQLKVPSAGVCEAINVATLSASLASGRAWPKDQYSEITLLTGLNATGFTGVLARGSGTGSYALYWQGAFGSQITINLGVLTSSSLSSISTFSATPNVGDVWRLTVTGNDATGGGAWLTATQTPSGGQAQSWSAQDDSGLSNGNGAPGIFMFSPANVNLVQVSLWAGGGVVVASVANCNQVLVEA